MSAPRFGCSLLVASAIWFGIVSCASLPESAEVEAPVDRGKTDRSVAADANEPRLVPESLLPSRRALQIVPQVLYASTGKELVVPIYLGNPTEELLVAEVELAIGRYKQELVPVELPAHTVGRFERAAELPSTLRAGTYHAQLTVRPSGAAAGESLTSAFRVELESRPAIGVPIRIDDLWDSDVIAWPTEKDARALDARLLPSGTDVRLGQWRFYFPPTISDELNAVALAGTKTDTARVIRLEPTAEARKLALLVSTLGSSARIVASAAEREPAVFLVEESGDCTLSSGSRAGCRVVLLSNEPLSWRAALFVLWIEVPARASKLELHTESGSAYLLAATRAPE